MGSQWRDVRPEDWLATVERARRDGFDYFDWLGCTDDIGHSDTFRLTLLLRAAGAGRTEPGAGEPAAGAAWRSTVLTTSVPRTDPVLDSLRSVFAGAGWHEREATELFGVQFRGGDSRRLLLSPSFDGTPLRKEEVLAPRTAVGWPGAKEPGESGASPSRRRLTPPGVPDPQVWGDRQAGDPAADPAEVAASVAGTRARRRSR